MLEFDLEPDDITTEEISLCSCGNIGEVRVCPYVQELMGHAEHLLPCKCCLACAGECAADI